MAADLSPERITAAVAAVGGAAVMLRLLIAYERTLAADYRDEIERLRADRDADRKELGRLRLELQARDDELARLRLEVADCTRGRDDERRELKVLHGEVARLSGIIDRRQG